MATAAASVEVDVPVEVAYEAWTHFEHFPHYLAGVKEVTRNMDGTLHWVVSPAGVEREFEAAVTEDVPNSHISWASVGELHHAGSVRFTPLNAQQTKVDVEFDWEPEGFVENVGAAVSADSIFAGTSLRNFKQHVEDGTFPGSN